MVGFIRRASTDLSNNAGAPPLKSIDTPPTPAHAAQQPVVPAQTPAAGIVASLSASRSGSQKSKAPAAPKGLVDEEPDSVICATLRIKGELAFERLLRVEGSFEGQLCSTGSLIVGPKGSIVGDVKGLKEVLVDGGSVHGNFECVKLILRNGACITGNVSCDTMSIDGTCKLQGNMDVKSMSASEAA